MSSSSPDATVATADCEALWTRYHALVPIDPYSGDEHTFIARCERSERKVLTCPEIARARVLEIVQRVSPEADAGADPKADEAEIAFLMPRVMPTHMAICMTCERLLFAQRSGELAQLARDVSAKKWTTDESGVIVVDKSYATLPSKGMIEDANGASADHSPPGEVRVRTMSDGRVWLYFLGGLLGRHQNQVGFVYSSGPFIQSDFESNGPVEEVCMQQQEASRRNGEPKRYLLPCFRVVTRHSPQLLEVGASPD